MSARLDDRSSSQLTLFAEDSRAKMSVAPARGLALAVLEAAYGSRWRELLKNYGPGGLLSRTLPVADENGSMRSGSSWNGSDMGAYRSRLAQRIAALGTREIGSLSLPTLVSSSSTNRCTKNSPSTLAGTHGKYLSVEVRLLPTLTRSSYGSNKGGSAGRTGLDRPSLSSIAGGRLNPTWLEWFMGFPEGWTNPIREATEPEWEERELRKKRRSETPLSPNAGKSSVG